MKTKKAINPEDTRVLHNVTLANLRSVERIIVRFLRRNSSDDAIQVEMQQVLRNFQEARIECEIALSSELMEQQGFF